MTAEVCQWALKEWAVTIRALDEGQQILLLRKGGIREKVFTVAHQEFLLYPTYEHQRANLLKPAFHNDLISVLDGWDGDTEQVSLTHWARVTDVFEVTEREAVEALSPYYIWTAAYAEERLHWRPRNPLAVLLVRVYRLPTPFRQRVETSFTGCKSWIDLSGPVPVTSAFPVLNDLQYQHRVDTVRAVLEPSARTE